MKKQKLNLEKIQVQSFITQIERNKLGTIYAGDGNGDNGSANDNNCSGACDPSPVLQGEEEKKWYQSVVLCSKIGCG